ncbi:DUF3147 family protein [Actinoplanes sp. NPDC051411]|jgi:uncharacterized membrane protein (GlpM family)|uniref:DUF3147 family protein n=1 Tax=Actinoplanes sp. NPDC051411 TaxID=3155522 RepID=UPI003420AE24
MTDQSPDAIRASGGKLSKPPMRDWFIRFGFGAVVSAVAGLVSVIGGPRAGGVFLAFPAILLASLTLVAKQEGEHQAREDARGGVFGTIGLLAFAVVVAVAATRWPLWATLVTASMAWIVVALLGYGVARMAAAGGDESPRDDTSDR